MIPLPCDCLNLQSLLLVLSSDLFATGNLFDLKLILSSSPYDLASFEIVGQQLTPLTIPNFAMLYENYPQRADYSSLHGRGAMLSW